MNINEQDPAVIRRRKAAKMLAGRELKDLTNVEKAIIKRLWK